MAQAIGNGITVNVRNNHGDENLSTKLKKVFGNVGEIDGNINFNQLCQGKVNNAYAEGAGKDADIVIASNDGGGEGGAIRTFIFININNDRGLNGKVFYIDLICSGVRHAMELKDKTYGTKAIPLIQKLQQICTMYNNTYKGIRLSALDHVQMFYDKKLGFKSRTHWGKGRILNRITPNQMINGVPMLWVVPDDQPPQDHQEPAPILFCRQKRRRARAIGRKRWRWRWL